jgi:proteasome assembly chaperone (PAC2) family protein
MADTVQLVERPQTQHLTMIVGWRQWADAGSVSSGLPQYLVQQTNARRIGHMSPDGFYLFQIPGTHDLVRPVVKFQEGYPQSLETPRNEFFYTGNDERGTLIFVGDEPHLDIERYVAAILETAQSLGVKRIIGLGGVYGELPYNKERLISSNYSLPRLKDEVSRLAVNLSDYHGGASIGSYICRRSGDRNLEYVGLYAFVPTYDFSNLGASGNAIRIETDFMAWFSVMRRINYMLKSDFDLHDLERRSKQLIRVMDGKIEEIEQANPDLDVREYLDRLTEEFTEVPFDPLDDLWEEEINKLLDDES